MTLDNSNSADESETDEYPDIYEYLGIEKDIAQKDIKRKYHMACLKYHPDKQSKLSDAELQEVTIEFATILKYYKVLLDETSRKHYDTTGRLAHDGDQYPSDWNAYFNELWQGVVSSTTIDDFKRSYQHSEEERLDVIRIYKERKGNVEEIMECILCAHYTDEPRFIKMIEHEIKENGMMCYKKFKTDCSKAARNKRIKNAEDEEQEFKGDADLNESQDDYSELKSVIKKRDAERVDDIAKLIEKKYIKTSKDEKRLKAFEEPSDEVFAAIQARMLKKK